jgi:thiol-disulfide isomerase/thioredoxin
VTAAASGCHDESVTRVRAPHLQGRGWLNTGGAALPLEQLRGKIVLLDFWTFCCINCLHVLDELRDLEARYADVLVVIGVHSPKFEHEADPVALAAAVERYGVHHPVLDDPELSTWQQYAVRAWPTLVVVDPEGYVVAHHSGEGHAHALEVLVAELVAKHEENGTLHRGDSPYVPPTPRPSTLRFPAKVVRLDDGSFLVADAGHHALTQLAADAETLVRSIGTGERGLADGMPDVAQLNEPNGLCLLPPDVASDVGYDLVVADTVNHALRGVRLDDGLVTTVAGTGRQWMQGDPLPGRADARTPLSSPWDVVWHPGWDEVVVAMAGIHQIWSFDPRRSTVSVRGGTTNEGLVDGDAARAWFAQPSGIDVVADTIWLVDSETSSLRRITNGVVHTEVGLGLFDFGFADGPAAGAMMQHPLGCAVLPDGSVAVADTYNAAVRRFDPLTRQVSTLATGLAEPSDVVVEGEHLVVVESTAHRLTRLRLPDVVQQVRGEARRTHRPPTRLAPGTLDVVVTFVPPAGQHLDERYGPATHLVVSASPPQLLVDGAGSGGELSRRVVLDAAVGSGVLHVSVRAASCDDEGEHPACHIHQQDWGVPVELAPDGDAVLELVLAGSPSAPQQ